MKRLLLTTTATQPYKVTIYPTSLYGVNKNWGSDAGKIPANYRDAQSTHSPFVGISSNGRLHDFFKKKPTSLDLPEGCKMAGFGI
jgi:hypothetical protein